GIPATSDEPFSPGMRPPSGKGRESWSLPLRCPPKGCDSGKLELKGLPGNGRSRSTGAADGFERRPRAGWLVVCEVAACCAHVDNCGGGWVVGFRFREVHVGGVAGCVGCAIVPAVGVRLVVVAGKRQLVGAMADRQDGLPAEGVAPAGATIGAAVDDGRI